MAKEIRIDKVSGSYPIFVVKENSAALRVLMRQCRRSLKPGEIIRVTKEEFESLKNDVITIKKENHESPADTGKSKAGPGKEDL